MPGRLSTVGYEGLTLDALVDRLRGAGVTHLVDVRMTPRSRKPGFSRTRLSAALSDAGIGYVHERSLGNPPENRASFTRGDGTAGRERMRSILDDEGRDAVDRVVALARDGRVALLCFERDHTRCHRDVIAQVAVEREPTLEVVNIL